MIHKTIVVGPLQCNCALLACEETKEAILIDPGAEAEKIIAEVNQQGFSVKYAIHTHAHFDHIAGTKGVKEALNPTLCLHADDNDLYRNLPLQGRYFGMEFEQTPPIEKFLEHEEELTFGKNKVKVLHTPGHSPGSICLKVTGTEEKLFSGDTLFRRSIGRTDLWGGDHSTLIRSVKSRIFTLDDDMMVYPGHGPHTRVGEEKLKNPFLN